MKKWIILVIMAMAFGGLWFAHDKYVDMQNDKLAEFIMEMDVEEKLNIFIDREYGEQYYGVLDDYEEGDDWIYYNMYENDYEPCGNRIVSEYCINTYVWEYYQG